MIANNVGRYYTTR